MRLLPFAPLLLRRLRWSAAGLFLCGAGCTFYHPQPLNSTAVNQALQPLSLSEIKIATGKISHPLFPPRVIQGQGGFTPDEIGLIVVVTSPQLRALRDQRGVARAELLQAGILPNPQLGYELDRLHGDSGPGLVNGRSLGLSWEITALLSRNAQIAAAKQHADSLDLSIAWQEWQAYGDARLHAFRVLALERQLPLARQAEAGFAEAASAAREAFSHGEMTAPNLAAITDSWSQAQNERFTLEQQLSVESHALKLALNWPIDQPVPLKAGPAFPSFVNAFSDPAPELLAGLDDRRLDLLALKLGYASQEATLRAAVRAQFPKIGLTVNRANDTSDVKTHGFGVTIDLPLFDRNQGAIATAKATRQQLFDEYVARVAETRSEVHELLADLALNSEQMNPAQALKNELTGIRESLEKAFATGNTDAATFHTAQAAEVKAEIAVSELQEQSVELSLSLEIATGRPLLNQSTFH